MNSRPLAVLLFVALGACDAHEATDLLEPRFDGLIPREACYDPDDPICVNNYPLSDDPDPSAPGYYIGDAYTMAACRAGGYDGDIDDDGFDQKCEYRLAHAFAPLLSVSTADADLTRESYWVATYRPNNYYPTITEHVSILYLLGYHLDAGSDQCFGCTAHYGDSEFIRVDLIFDPISEHWQLWQVFLSAHWGTITESSAQVGFAGLTYPHRNRAYPRVYVAINKHANYKSLAACDAGAGYSDACPSSYDQANRVEVREDRNLGAFDTRLVNCVDSESPFTYGGTECFWQFALNFCGWYSGASPCASPYAAVLSDQDF